jgi:hypothetical protein
MRPRAAATLPEPTAATASHPASSHTKPTNAVGRLLARSSITVSLLGPRLGLLSGWCRCSLLVTQFANDFVVGGCLSSDLSERGARHRPGARLLA